MRYNYEGKKYTYKGFFNCKSHCDIEIYRDGKVDIVIATESDDNPGTSITNMAERIATNVCYDFGINHDDLIWIEHYPKRNKLDETYDLVTFTWDKGRFKKPVWQAIDKDRVNILINGHEGEI